MFKRIRAPEAPGTDALPLQAATQYAAVLRQVFDLGDDVRIERVADDDYYEVIVPVPLELYEDTDRRLDAERAVHEAIEAENPAAVGRVAIRYRPA